MLDAVNVILCHSSLRLKTDISRQSAGLDIFKGNLYK